MPQQPQQTTFSDGEVTIMAPDFSLKKAIGKVDLHELFSPDVVEHAQRNIASERANFLDWAAEDLATLEHAYRGLMHDVAHGQPSLQKIRRAAFSLKSQAGTFGYDLASQIGRSFYTFCDVFGYHEEQCVVLRKHIDVLQLIFRKNISGNGGAMGQDLVREVERLAAKFRAT